MELAEKETSSDAKIQEYYELFLMCKPLLGYMETHFENGDILCISTDKIKILKGHTELLIENCGLKN